MSTELKVHDFQMSILRELLFKHGARFRDLKKVDVTSDHFSFHVNHLVAEGLIEKSGGKYFLTTSGKEFANRMDTDILRLERQAKVAVAIHAVRVRNGRAEYLVHRRLKEPFYGWYGSNSGKIRWGENPMEAAKREFFEETGLTGDFALKGIVHYHHIYKNRSEAGASSGTLRSSQAAGLKNGQFLEDKYFWVFRVEDTRGAFRKRVPEGENKWIGEEEYRKLGNVFATFDEVVK